MKDTTKAMMNIYVLDEDPVIAAKYNNDRHIGSGILDSAQIMSMAHLYLDGPRAVVTRKVEGPLKDLLDAKATQQTPPNRQLRGRYVNGMDHPCAVWARSSTGAYRWLHTYMGALLSEFAARYGRIHVYGFPPKAGLYTRLAQEPYGLPKAPAPPFAQAMPKRYVRSDPVQAYRLYYFYEKSHLARWRDPAVVPAWWDALGVSEIRRLMKLQLTRQQGPLTKRSIENVSHD